MERYLHYGMNFEEGRAKILSGHAGIASNGIVSGDSASLKFIIARAIKYPSREGIACTTLKIPSHETRSTQPG
jgi:hypothetical protein